jgi:hypothetical protein
MRLDVQTEIDVEIDDINIEELSFTELVRLWERLTEELQDVWLACWCPTCKEWKADYQQEDGKCVVCETILTDTSAKVVLSLTRG